MARRKSKNVARLIPRLVYDQKYTLQRRDDEGSFRKVATYSHVISQEDVLKEHGPGNYILRATKPRFHTVWTAKLGVDDTKQLKDLEKKAKHLTYGVVAVGAVEIVGFGVSGWMLWDLRKRTARIEAVLGSFKPLGLNCTSCGKPIDRFLNKFCSQCGSALEWPENQLPIGSFTSTCVNCGLQLQAHQAFCPSCGKQRPIQVHHRFLPYKP